MPGGSALASVTVSVPLPLAAGGIMIFVVVPPAETATGSEVDVLIGTATDAGTTPATLGTGVGVDGITEVLEPPPLPPPHPTTSTKDTSAQEHWSKPRRDIKPPTVR